MSVRTSESTANTPGPARGPKAIAQNQFVYVVFLDDRDRKYYVIDVAGNVFASAPQANTIVQETLNRSVGLGPVLFMAGSYDLELVFPADCSIVGSGYKTLFNCAVNADRVSISDMTVNGTMVLHNSRLTHMQTRDVIHSENCHIEDSDIAEISSHGDTLLFNRLTKCSTARLSMLQGNVVDTLDVGANTTGIIANNIITHYKESPNKAIINNNIGVNTQNKGTQVFDGDGLTRDFTFMHGLIRTPAFVSVNAGSEGALRQPMWWNWTSDDVMVVFREAPKPGRNNIVLHWFASI